MSPLEKVKRLRDAVCAHCETCDVDIKPSVFWGLSTRIWLHRSGSKGGCKITLYGWPQ